MGSKPTAVPKQDTDQEKRLDDLDAELSAALADAEDQGRVENNHPFLTAQAFALERRDFKAAFVRLSIAARVRRKLKDHSEAERLFTEALKARDGIVAVDSMVKKQSPEVQAHFRTILTDWDADLEDQLQQRERQREARAK